MARVCARLGVAKIEEGTMLVTTSGETLMAITTGARKVADLIARPCSLDGAHLGEVTNAGEQ